MNDYTTCKCRYIDGKTCIKNICPLEKFMITNTGNINLMISVALGHDKFINLCHFSPLNNIYIAYRAIYSSNRHISCNPCTCFLCSELPFSGQT